MTTIRPELHRSLLNDLVERAGLGNAYVREFTFTPESIRVEVLVADRAGAILAVEGREGLETVSAWFEIPYADVSTDTTPVESEFGPVPFRRST